MRNDLTAAFQSEMTRKGRAPVQLLAFYFPTAGTVRVSDRAVGIADGLADDWAGLVEDWGTLEDITDATDPAEVTIEARQMSVTLINRGDKPFSNYFLSEDPEGITAELFQWFDGLAEADKVLIDRFVVADPIRFSERSRLVTLDLVSAVVNMDTLAGGLLSAADWPAAKGDDVGQAIDLPFGSVGRVPALCAKTAPAATLAGSILAGSLSIQVNEDLDALAFSAAGVLQVEEELIRYGSRTASAFAVIQRGYQSTAVEHLDRVAVVELITDHTYIVGRGPVQSVDNVQVGGYPAPAAIYATDPAADPARIVFSEKPYAYRFAAGSSFLSMQFDAIGADNTAVQPHYAYDDADDATAARIDVDHPVLSLKQVTINPDRGEIVRAYLAVEHWEGALIVNDYAEVWVEGVGVVGRLSRPSPEEGITIEAEVDIDHGHAHAIGGEHTHSFIDPTLQTDETPHTHVTTDVGSTASFYPPPGDEAFALMAPYDVGWIGDHKAVTFENAPTSWDGALLHFKCNVGGTQLYAAGQYVASGERTINLGARSSGSTFVAHFQAFGNGVYYAQAAVWEVSLIATVGTEILAANTGANTQVAISGRNQTTTSDKHIEDVQDLATDNVAVGINTADATTRTHVNLFDLTEQVAFDWGWFNDRDVKITYTGADDRKSIYILHVFFDVEFRRRERFFSDDISAEVAGLVDDGAGTCTGTPGAAITRPDHVARYLLTGPGGLAADLIDAATYAAAGARLAAKGYTIDGLIRGDATVKDALRKVAFQARLRPFWSAGLAKLAFVEALGDWPGENPITAADCQLNSIQVERQPATAIINQVDLFFARDWTNADDGPAGFGASVRASDPISQSRIGVRSNADRFRFDLVRGAAMAADLADFYCERYATPSSFYRVNAYLAQFALEKEDKVQLSSAWNRLQKAKMRVLAASRVFGSGKNNAINHVALLLECLRYILLNLTEADAVRALDALDLSVGKSNEFGEAVDLADLLAATLAPALDETITPADALALVQLMAPQFAETVTPADALEHGIGIGVTDTAKLADDLVGWRQYGFGGGQFGIVGFGGWVNWHESNPDEVAAVDDLAAAIGAGAMTDAVTVGEALGMSSGFGGAVGDGFGATPFGL